MAKSNFIFFYEVFFFQARLPREGYCYYIVYMYYFYSNLPRQWTMSQAPWSWVKPWVMWQLYGKDPMISSPTDTMVSPRLLYNPLITWSVFALSTHNRHPIACPSGQAMGCLLWVQSLICGERLTRGESIVSRMLNLQKNTAKSC